MKLLCAIASLILVACDGRSQEDTPANATALAVRSDGACELPQLDFVVTDLDVKEKAKLTDNFRTAFDRACDEKLLGGKPLVDPRSDNRSRLVVFDAPEANVVSIYFSQQSHGAWTILEAPLGPKRGIPTADDLHEAIYCAVEGATPEEEETSGRCLPD